MTLPCFKSLGFPLLSTAAKQRLAAAATVVRDLTPMTTVYGTFGGLWHLPSEVADLVNDEVSHLIHSCSFEATPTFIVMEPHAWISPHTDTRKFFRRAALVDAIIPEKYAPTMFWKENGKILATMRKTDLPALFNPQVQHSVLNNNARRVNFQLSLNASFNEVLEAIEAGTLFKRP